MAPYLESGCDTKLRLQLRKLAYDQIDQFISFGNLNEESGIGAYC